MFSDWQSAVSGEHRTILQGEVGDIEAIIHLPDDYDESRVKAIAVCCHPHPLYEGAMSNKVVHTLAKAFAKMGLVSVRFNFRGVGQSEGEHDEGIGETDDLVKVCLQLSSYFEGASIWLAGFSFGSFIAANAAERINASQLISIAPPVDRYDFDGLVTNNSPWLVVMGEEDEIVPPAGVFEWIDRHPGRCQLIRFPETGHFFHGKLVKLSDQLITHFEPIVEAL